MILAANRSAKERNVMQSMYLSADQHRELLSTVGANAILVLQHYVGISYQPNPNMEDAQVAKISGFKPQTVKRARLALTKAGWFLCIKNTYQGEPQRTYLIGKQAVQRRSFAFVKI